MCVPEEGAGTAKNVPAFELGSVFEVIFNRKGRVLTGATPEKFKEYFGKQLKRARDEYKSDYIFIFAWNEWSEGGYLEPDMKNQYGYLDAIKKALEDLNE